METYRDGTPIPQVTDPTEWINLTTGAWRYGDIDSSQGKLYNWYAVMGIHDNDESTSDKEFAPQGWHVPSDTEWMNLEDYLITNGFNYDGTNIGNKIAKSMASSTGWSTSTEAGAVGNNPSTNNISEFNGFPNGAIVADGGYDTNSHSVFWTSTEHTQLILKSWNRSLTFTADDLGRNKYDKTFGFSVRFVQDSDSCSEVSITASSTEVCAGESVDITVDSLNSDFSNWATSEPNNLALGTEHFGLFLSTGRWNDGPDSYTSANCIIESENNLGVVSNFTFMGVFENHYYYLYNQSDGWTNCNNLAASLGGYLAIINSQLETNFIVSNLPSSYDRGWIGMYQDTNHPDYSEPGGAWFWLDGTPVPMTSNTTTFTWSTGDTTANSTVTPTETTEYWVDVTTNGVTCREYITIDVTAPPAPTGNVIGEACSDLTVGTNNNSFNGENIQWYDSIESQTPLPNDTLLVDGTTYYISQTVDGCESIDRFEILILAPLPTITIDNPIICEGESTTVSVSTNPFLGTVTYLWNSDENETSDFIITAPTESSGGWVDVSLIYEYEGGIVQNLCRYFYSITVQEAPESPVSGGDITECETIVAQNLEATASVSTGQTIVWYDAASGGNVVTDPSLSAAGTATYYAETINDDSGCSSLSRTSVTLTITSIAAPTGDAVQSFCNVSTIADLMVTGDNIQWYVSSTGDTLLDQTTVLTDGQLVYASQTENECESIDRLGVSVEIDIITDPILLTTELDFCLAREATLADLEIDAQGFELEWYDSFSGGTILATNTLLEDNVSYYATLYDVESGCESLMRLEVVPIVIPCEVIIFNAISINDNGLNDYMVIENAEYFPFNSLEIFNRDGHLIYSQKKYGVSDSLFRGVANVDGIYSKGSNLPTGSYLYVFTYYNPYSQEYYTKKGFLTINSN